MLIDKKSSKLLERIMIKYIHKYNDRNFFYNTNYKIDALNIFDA